MLALDFWKAVTVDRSNAIETVFQLLDEHGIRYCVIGGQGVNGYVDPVVCLDLDLVVATDQIAQVDALLTDRFRVERFPFSLNVSFPDSNLRLQIQTDPRYSAFAERAATHDVLGLNLPVARLEDVLQGKVWAALDPAQRASKRQKDLADIARILERYPEMRGHVPAQLLERLV